ncbi:MAG: hypothetical protein O7F11_05510 [Acidobacteria bacterium]|nr:hypothetical protein [Acidobacteriota bacterium]
MTDTVQVGAQVEAQCGRCHDATNHIILTVDKGKPKRARCSACAAEHLYRKPKGLEEVRPRRAGSRKDDPETAYKKVLEETPPGDAVKYSVKAHFKEGQRVAHKSFGEGVVLRILRPQVAEVIFLDATRLLAMDR